MTVRKLRRSCFLVLVLAWGLAQEGKACFAADADPLEALEKQDFYRGPRAVPHDAAKTALLAKLQERQRSLKQSFQDFKNPAMRAGIRLQMESVAEEIHDLQISLTMSHIEWAEKQLGLDQQRLQTAKGELEKLPDAPAVKKRLKLRDDPPPVVLDPDQRDGATLKVLVEKEVARRKEAMRLLGRKIRPFQKLKVHEARLASRPAWLERRLSRTRSLRALGWVEFLDGEVRADKRGLEWLHETLKSLLAEPAPETKQASDERA